MSQNVGKLRKNLIPDSNATVMPEDIERCIYSCPKEKAPGYNGITYEYLKPVASAVSTLLGNLFTVVLRTMYIPDILKCGVIITLHKGGSKPKDTG